MEDPAAVRFESLAHACGKVVNPHRVQSDPVPSFDADLFALLDRVNQAVDQEAIPSRPIGVIKTQHGGRH